MNKRMMTNIFSLCNFLHNYDSVYYSVLKPEIKCCKTVMSTSVAQKLLKVLILLDIIECIPIMTEQ